MATDIIARGMAASAKAGGSVPAYVGLVSNNLYAPVQLVTGNNTINAKIPFFARDNITGACIVRLPNFYLSATTPFEVGPGATASVTMKLEYPAGTFTTITFGGNATGTIPNGGTLDSDPFTPAVPIPNGARGWWRIWFQNASGLPVVGRGSQSGATGGGITFSTNGADQTGNTGFTPTDPWNYYGPIVFASKTTSRSYLILGDSREQDLSTFGDMSYDFGLLGKSIGPKRGVSSCSITGGGMAGVTNAQRANSLGVAAFVTDVIDELGYNDRALGVPAVQAGWQTLYTGIKAVNAKVRIGQTTLPLGTTASTPNTALTSLGTTATAVVSAAAAAELFVGETIAIAGATPSGYNGTVIITAISGTSISYTLLAGATGLAAASPAGTLSDLWQSVRTRVFQVPVVSAANLATLNDSIRHGLAQTDYFLELADFFEDGRNSGYWKPNLSIDGVHFKHYAEMLFKGGGGVTASIPGF